MKYAKIDRNSSGEIVAAVTGKRIRVLSYVIVAAGSVTLTWQSGTTDLSGAMSMVEGVPIPSGPVFPLPGGIMGQFQTERGEALNLELSAGVQVSGHLVYVETA